MRHPRFQSFPAFEVYATVTDPEDWSRDSAFAEFRMRHPDGNAQALAMMQRHFRVPQAHSAPSGGGRSQQQLFDDYLWLTQAQQARCYETAFKHWRRQRGAPANTMGILYWRRLATDSNMIVAPCAHPAPASHSLPALAASRTNPRSIRWASRAE